MEPSLSAAALVARCRTGDENAWAELVNRFSRYVYAIATKGFSLRADDAEDVFQEVFARVYSHLDRLRDDEAIRPWIAQLTRRVCIDSIRASGRSEPREAPPEAAVDDAIGTIEEALDVHAALDSLGEPCREMLDRFFCRDESYRTIGDALGLPGGTIASRISRCLAKLRRVLEGRDAPLPPSGEVR